MLKTTLSTRGLALPFLLLAGFFFAQGQALAKESGERRTIWSTVPYFNWVKQTAAPLEQFSFFINGKQAASSAIRAVKFQDSLHVRFPLTYEAHTMIDIRQQGQGLFSADIFYAPSYESNIVPDESTYLPFHTAGHEKSCQRCHRLTIEPTDYDPPQAQKQLCYSCHQHKFDGQKSLHKPAAVQWRCLQCHRTAAKPNRWSPDQPLRFSIEDGDKVAPLCYKCHQKFEARIKGYRFLHGPIGMGGCTMCHNPHASAWPKLLQNDQTTLCVNCHELKDMISKPVVHQVIKTKGCTACHHPHGSQYPLQLAHTINDQCASCHPAISKQGNNHPVQGHPVFIKAGNQGKKDKLTCVSCHSPHSSDFPKLLPDGETMMLCARCHSREIKQP